MQVGGPLTRASLLNHRLGYPAQQDADVAQAGEEA